MTARSHARIRRTKRGVAWLNQRSVGAGSASGKSWLAVMRKLPTLDDGRREQAERPSASSPPRPKQQMPHPAAVESAVRALIQDPSRAERIEAECGESNSANPGSTPWLTRGRVGWTALPKRDGRSRRSQQPDQRLVGGPRADAG
jgi:hypothetical protein